MPDDERRPRALRDFLSACRARGHPPGSSAAPAGVLVVWALSRSPAEKRHQLLGRELTYPLVRVAASSAASASSAIFQCRVVLLMIATPEPVWGSRRRTFQKPMPPPRCSTREPESRCGRNHPSPRSYARPVVVMRAIAPIDSALNS